MFSRLRLLLIASNIAVFGAMAWVGPAHHLVLTNVDPCDQREHHGPSDSESDGGHCDLCHFQKYSSQHFELARLTFAAEQPSAPIVNGAAPRAPLVGHLVSPIRGPPNNVA